VRPGFFELQELEAQAPTAPELDRAPEQIAAIEAHSRGNAVELNVIVRRAITSQRLRTASGIGLITATALIASVGDFARFPSGCHLACALGLTPKEHSSGHKRRLGRITKRGDTSLRMLLVHGARSALNAARGARKRCQALDRTQTWALQLADRVGHNKAAVALANKTVRRLWAAEHHGQAFDPNHRSTHRDH